MTLPFYALLRAISLKLLKCSDWKRFGWAHRLQCLAAADGVRHLWLSVSGRGPPRNQSESWHCPKRQSHTSARDCCGSFAFCWSLSGNVHAPIWPRRCSFSTWRSFVWSALDRPAPLSAHSLTQPCTGPALRNPSLNRQSRAWAPCSGAQSHLTFSPALSAISYSQMYRPRCAYSHSRSNGTAS